MAKRTKRQQAILKRRIFLSFCSLVLIAAIALLSFVIGSAITGDNNGNNSGNNSSTPKPEPIPDKFATIVSVGDIMCHNTQIQGAKPTMDMIFRNILPNSHHTLNLPTWQLAILKPLLGVQTEEIIAVIPAVLMPLTNLVPLLQIVALVF